MDGPLSLRAWTGHPASGAREEVVQPHGGLCGCPEPSPMGGRGDLCVEELTLELWDVMMGSLPGQGQEWGQTSGPHGRRGSLKLLWAGRRLLGGPRPPLIPPLATVLSVPRPGGVLASALGLRGKACAYARGSGARLVPGALRA